MRVGIDATELRPGAPGGVRRALFLLLDALERHAPDVEVSALAPGPVEAPRGVRVVQTGGPTTPRRWRKSRELRNALRRLDLFHSPVTAIPAFDDVPMTATVHELPFMSAPVDGAVRVAIQNYWLTRALSRCRALVVPSHATLRQLLGAHPCARRKTHVVPHPAPPAPDSEQRTHDGSLLFVGRLDRRKRVEALVLSGAQLRLAGPHTEMARTRIQRAARRAGASQRLIFMGEVDEAALDRLYRQACAVGLVSVSEGFGFPVLEALARGVPVITAPGTGATEVAGDLALVADGPDEVAAAMRRAAEPAFREMVHRKGPARVLQFRPERTARGYVEVFARALDG